MMIQPPFLNNFNPKIMIVPIANLSIIAGLFGLYFTWKDFGKPSKVDTSLTNFTRRHLGAEGGTILSGSLSLIMVKIGIGLLIFQTMN